MAQKDTTATPTASPQSLANRFTSHRFCPQVLAFCLAPLACSPQLASEAPGPETQRRIEGWVEAGEEVGFSYAVVSSEGTLFQFHAGRLDAAREDRVTAQTRFLSASSTKVLTTLAILRLVDQGKLSLDDPLSKYVPAQPYGREVTVRGLLNHSAGIPNPLPLGWLHMLGEHPTFDEQAALAQALRNHPQLEARPGEEYRYSNLGYWLLGAVVRSVSGTTYKDFVTSEVLLPLGIAADDLGFEQPSEAERARGHFKRFSLLGLLLPVLTERKFRIQASGIWGRFEYLYMNGPAYGGAIATTRGYAAVLQDLLSAHSRILSDASLAALFAPQQDRSGRELPVSLGLHRGQLGGHSYLEKPGGGPGFSANVRIYKDLGIATVFLSNQMRVSEQPIRELSDELDRPFVASRAPAP